MECDQNGMCSFWNMIKTECAPLGMRSKWNLPFLGCALFGLAHFLSYYLFPDMTGVHSQ